MPKSLVLAVLALVALPAQGADEWRLVAAESTLYFVGIKNNEAAVPGGFSGLSGGLDVEGRGGWIEVDVASLDSGDAERDRNLRIHIFAIDEHPSVRFTVREVTGADALPPVGGSVAVDVAGTLSIRGNAVDVTVPVRLHREGPRRVRLQSSRPLALTSQQLGLEQAFAVLKAVCGHLALSGAVPVQFDVVFEG